MKKHLIAILTASSLLFAGFALVTFKAVISDEAGSYQMYFDGCDKEKYNCEEYANCRASGKKFDYCAPLGRCKKEGSPADCTAFATCADGGKSEDECKAEQ